jgi:ketosteroid isomerase-like protein
VTPDERVQVVRGAAEQAMAHGPRTLLDRYDELFTEDFRWRPAAQGLIEGLREYRGREGFEQYWDDFEASFSGFGFTNGRFTAVGDDTVLARFRLAVYGTGSGVPVEQDAAWVLRFDGDRIAYGESFMNQDDAEAAAHA